MTGREWQYGLYVNDHWNSSPDKLTAEPSGCGSSATRS